MASTDAVDAIEVNWKGQSYLLLEEDAKRIREEVTQFVSGYVDILDRTFKTSRGVVQRYHDNAQLKNGFLKAVSQMVVLKVANVRFPDTALDTRASQAISKVRGVLSEKKLVAMGAALQEAETAINAYYDDINRFLKEFGQSAYVTGTTLAVTTSAGFAVLGALGAGMLVVGGLTATQAAVISGASVKALQAGVDVFARALDGQEIDPFQEMTKFNIDALVGAATGAVGSKIDAKLMAPVVDAAAKQLAGRMSYLASDQAVKFVTNFLNSAGQATAISAANEAIEYIGNAVKNGQTPTEDDLRKSFEKFLIGALVGTFMKNMEVGEDKAVELAKKAVETKLGPEAIKRLAPGTTIDSAKIAKMSVDTGKALSEDIGKSAVNGIVAAARGDESADKLGQLGAAAVEKDANLKRLIDAEIKRQLQKNKIAVK